MKNETTKAPGSTVGEISYSLKVEKAFLNMTQKPETTERKFYYTKFKNICIAKRRKFKDNWLKERRGIYLSSQKVMLCRYWKEWDHPSCPDLECSLLDTVQWKKAMICYHFCKGNEGGRKNRRDTNLFKYVQNISSRRQKTLGAEAPLGREVGGQRWAQGDSTFHLLIFEPYCLF